MGAMTMDGAFGWDENVTAARAAWLAALTAERGRAANTAEAYERDTRQFLSFLSLHLGGPPDFDGLSALRPADIRAFLAARKREGAGPRTLARILAGVRAMLSAFERTRTASTPPRPARWRLRRARARCRAPSRWRRRGR